MHVSAHMCWHKLGERMYLERITGVWEKPPEFMDGLLNSFIYVAIRRYFELGCEVKGLGRGHIHRIKESVRKSSY